MANISKTVKFSQLRNLYKLVNNDKFTKSIKITVLFTLMSNTLIIFRVTIVAIN